MLRWIALVFSAFLLVSCAPKPATISGSVEGAGEGVDVAVISAEGKRRLEGTSEIAALGQSRAGEDAMQKALQQWFLVVGTYERGKAKTDATGKFVCDKVEFYNGGGEEECFVTAHTKNGEEHNFWVMPVKVTPGASTQVALSPANRWAATLYHDEAKDHLPVENALDIKSRSSMSSEEICAQAAKSTGTITTPGSLGSGFFVGKGLFVTNHHVIDDALNNIQDCKIKIAAPDGGPPRTLIPSKILVDEPGNDLALLEVHESTLQYTPNANLADVPALPLVRSFEKPKQGQTVYSYGSPIGYEGTFAQGTISALRTGKDTIDKLNRKLKILETGGGDVLQITVPTSHGNSGGPLMNANGEVIGVVFAAEPIVQNEKGEIESAQNVNFAIGVAHVRQLLATARQ